jgi:hypothetical protein
MQALPVPQAGASIELLREFINVTNDEDFILVVAWLASAVRASTEYPILTLCGQSGAAKSTGARCLKRLIDPYALSERGPPRNELELYVACHQTHVVGLDNLSKIPPWLADALCRVATGAGFACRTHYTNRDETIFHGGRPIITTSINHLMDREDLAARNLLIEVSEIPENKRLTSAEYWEKFDAARPQLLGAVLDVVVHGLKTLPTLSFGRRPRMAEFAVFAQACEGAISQVAGSFERAYAGNRQRSAEEIVDADLVGTAVCKLMEKRRAFEGTAADLLVTLSRLLSEEQRRSPDWPLVPNRLSNRIKNLAQALHMVGIEVRRGYQGDGRQSRRKIILRAEDR